MVSFSNFEHQLKQDAVYIIGLSGGVDSVVLLNLLHKIAKTKKITLIAAHLNHGWRDTALRDQQLCETLCAQLSIQLIVDHLKNRTINIQNSSKEAIARAARRDFFAELQSKYTADRIILAHHLDDQLETFFVRLARGSSLTGLCGMKQDDGIYLRPLLSYSKETIISYAQEHQLSWGEDETNNSPAYLRNRIRMDLVPVLTKIDERLPKHVINTMEHLQEVNHYLEKQTLVTLHELQHPNNPQQYHYPSFLTIDPVMQQRVLLHMLIAASMPFTPHKQLFQEIIRFLKNNKTNKHSCLHGFSCIKEKQYFYFIKNMV